MNWPKVEIGRKIPLINKSKNLMMVENNIISEGLSAGGAEMRVPRDEKQKAAMMVPTIKSGVKICKPKVKVLMTKIIPAIVRPKTTEPRISPSRIAQRVIGAETNLSKVFILVSQGAITGVIAETVKNRAIAISIGVNSRKLKLRL